MPQDNQYTSFMLRMQRVRIDQQRTWLISMQRVGAGELRWFPDLDALVAFLRAELGDANVELRETNPDAQDPSMGLDGVSDVGV